MAAVAPFPAPGEFIKAVREHPHWTVQDFGISIDDEAIHNLLLSPAFQATFHRLSAALVVALPLKFSTIASELNVLSIVSLLNFASGYRMPLREATGRGAWDTIRYLVISLYLSSTSGEGDLLSARGMQSIDDSKIASALNINIHVEKSVDTIPGITIGQLGGPLYEMVVLIRTVLNETGEMLENQGYPDLGTFVRQAFEEGAKTPSSAVDIIVERLVRAIPGLQDMSIVEGKNIYIFKKAFFLVLAVSNRFKHLSPPPFPIPDISNMPIMSDNVIPSMLVYFGVIKLESCVFKRLQTAFPSVNVGALLSLAPEHGNGIGEIKSGPLLNAPEAFVLRAAAMSACERIVAIAATIPCESTGYDWIQTIKLSDLDMWLWSVAKDRTDYRTLPRFAEQGTTFY